jgi:hypothetical protein
LPWEAEPKFVIGELARKRGAESPNRLIASAKSWLSYAGVDRTAPILPWQAPDEVPKLSPVEASSQFLQYLRTVWDSGEAGEHAEHALAEQDVLLTVPASFDEEARELTRRAAEQAGYRQVTLLEEPLAAFYAWLESQGDAWRRRIKVGDLVLVCDVGGGTTDLSLIVVSEENGELTLKRVAVGDHIFCWAATTWIWRWPAFCNSALKPSGNRIDTWQLHGLWHQCRIEKEKLFESPKTQKRPNHFAGQGDEAHRRHHQDGTGARRPRPGSGRRILPQSCERRITLRGSAVPAFRSWVCRMRPIPAITKHLARFLSEQVRNSPEAADIRRGSERTGMSHAHPVQRRSDESGGSARPGGRGAEQLVAARRIRCARGGADPGSCPTWSTPWRAARPITARRVVVAACVSAVAPRARTTSELKAPCLPCPAWKLRSRRSASFPLAWKRAPRPRFPTASLASSSANQPSFVF